MLRLGMSIIIDKFGERLIEGDYGLFDRICPCKIIDTENMEKGVAMVNVLWPEGNADTVQINGKYIQKINEKEFMYWMLKNA
jgi:hypothetical protein